MEPQAWETLSMLPILRSFSEKYFELHALYWIARAERDRGNLGAARARIEEALDAIERLLVLSMFDEQGAEQDGFLRAHEIFNLNLPAELVVLSGCRTGLGKDLRGEGLVGLTRGFMYAGAARVLVSLWDVDDQATSELMGRLYRGMLNNRGLSPAAALREAQVVLWRDRRWQAPYYWAAFALQGEPR